MSTRGDLAPVHIRRTNTVSLPAPLRAAKVSTISPGVGVGVAVGVGVGVGVPHGLTSQEKISIESVGVVGAYPPASQMALVPSVSVGKLRRAVRNGSPG